MNLQTVFDFLKNAGEHHPVLTFFAVAGVGALVFLIVDAHYLKKRRRLRHGRSYRHHR